MSSSSRTPIMQMLVHLMLSTIRPLSYLHFFFWTLAGKLLISISLSFFLWFYFLIWNIFLCFSILLYFLLVSIQYMKLPLLPVLKRGPCVGGEPCHSTPSQLFVVSQISVLVQQAYHVFNSFQQNDVPRPVNVSKGRISAPRWRLFGSLILR